MSSVRGIAFAAMITTCFCCGYAQNGKSNHDPGEVIWKPPPIKWPDDSPAATIPKVMISTLRVGNFRVILENTKLEDVRKHFGGTIGSDGDAGDFQAWLCLRGGDPNGPWILWLTSGETDGPAIGGFEWKRLSPSEVPDRRCRLVSQGSGGIQLPLAIHPGMTEVDVRRVLGRPTVALGMTLFFFHEHQEMIHQLPFTAENAIAIVFRDGKVSVIQVWKSTMN